MNKLNLNAMGVTEMTAKEVKSIDGGAIKYDFRKSDLIDRILSLRRQGLDYSEELLELNVKYGGF